MTHIFTRRGAVAAAAAVVLGTGLGTGLIWTGGAHAGGHQVVESIHFLIPGGAGGGWDGTARGTGEALTGAGIVGSASYENMSGGGGGKAIGYLIENAKSNHGTLMVNSTPIVIRSLTKVFPQNFRDLTLIAGTIGDYAAFVVHKDSDLNSFGDLLTAYKANPRKVAIGGGSVPGGMDHLVAAMAMEAAGEDPTAVKYIPYDAGGKAMAALLSGEIKALSTGFSEAVALAQAGEVKIIGVTSADRVSAYPDAPTLKSKAWIRSSSTGGLLRRPGPARGQGERLSQSADGDVRHPGVGSRRARNGWVNIHNSGDAFRTFLEDQEKVIGDLMKKLGFL